MLSIVFGSLKLVFFTLIFALTGIFECLGGAALPAVVTEYPAVPSDGVTTTYQTGAGYTQDIDLPTDSVMVYTYNPSSYANWVKNSSCGAVDMMLAINRADTSYTEVSAERRAEIQVDSDGELYCHPSSDSVFYMVPTESFVEYICDSLSACLDIKAPRMIALEEPELFDDTGYSEAFKAEWRARYGEEWRDPASSLEAAYKSSKLKVYVFERAITAIAEFVKEKCPQTKIYIASHSTINYEKYGIISGLDSYARLPGVDGIIAQTWSDTARQDFKLDGARHRDTYSYAFAEYASYADTAKGKGLYALADPKADDPGFTWDEYRDFYIHTVAASLMQPEISSFEVCPWPERCFAASPEDYRSVQLNVYSALDAVADKPSTVVSGTPGIAVAISENFTWHSDESGRSPRDAMSGMSLPLIRDGIPLKFKSLDMIDSADDLADIKLLILSYEIMKPMSELTNIAVADWVRGGGTVLYIGGHDGFEDIGGEWWSLKGQTPLGNLFSHLGMNDIRVTASPDMFGTPGWSLGEVLKNPSLAAASFSAVRLSDAGCNAAFVGGGFDEIMSVGRHAVGIKKSVGEGSIAAFGFPAYLTSRENGSRLMRALTEYALSLSGEEYNAQSLTYVRRGNIVAYHSFGGGDTVTGKYIDLFSDGLNIVGERTLEAGESALYYDASALELDMPCLAFTGGRVSELISEAALTSYTVTSPAFAEVCARLFCADGIYPQSVSVVRDGRSITPHLEWDAENDSLLVELEGSPEGVRVSVVWGERETNLTNAEPVRRIVIQTNSENLDAEYLVKNTGYALPSLRFADGSGEIVYKFSLAEYVNPTFTLSVSQNYLISVSTDGENFTVTHDYSLINPVHLTTGGNDTLITLDPGGFGAEDSFYFKIANTDVSKGWGGTISRIVIRQYP